MNIHPASHSAIRELAYRLWEEDGRKEGRADQYWLEAERRLGGQPSGATSTQAVDDTIRDSFPASDPPASHIPDVPPRNAPAKWAAANKGRGKSGPKSVTPKGANPPG